MKFLRHTLIKAPVCTVLLLGWLGAFYHDAWFELAGVNHHHGQRQQNFGGHHHDHGDHHHHDHDDHENEAPSNDDGSKDDDSNNPIPLPDTHSLKIAFQRAKERHNDLLDAPLDFDLLKIGFRAVEVLDLRPWRFSSAEGAPPGYGMAVDILYSRIFLKNCVQSNAPPSLS